MEDKKEIIDYLRNQQKAAEIEAKVNGINIWVLIGAVAVVIWKLLSTVNSNFWQHQELILRVLICFEACYLINILCFSGHIIRDDVRYSSWRPSNMESPFLMLVIGILFFLPPGLFLLLVGLSLSALYIGMFGLIFFITGGVAIASVIIDRKGKPQRFPEPKFEQTRQSDMLSSLIAAVFLIFVIADQAASLRNQFSVVSVEIAQALSLIVALYLLLIVMIRRKLKSHSIRWTYELETDILLGIISPDVALRRIEHRALGPRLQDVMDNFFDELDRKFTELDSLRESCHSQLNSVNEIPMQYKLERSARLNEACAMPQAHIKELLSDCCEFSEYLQKLSKKKSGLRKLALDSILQSLASRHATYERRAKDAKKELDKLTASYDLN
jgi:membrane protein YdbS with pleckstrin-like domain